ncbi:uncharacterized protein [Antennarius striatus]|uniref:uncharacterized protein n=1 Tax=Antennarius striatus TaxID=241820 RepID=UPI0035B1FD3B
MNRRKRGGGRGSGPPRKRDTPVKSGTTRRDKYKRFVVNPRLGALPEEPEVMSVKTSPLVMSSEPVPDSEAFLPAPLAAHPAVQMPPNTEDDDVTEEEQNSSSTPESNTSSRMELETTFISDDDDDEESSDSAESTLPSPEIFRKDHYENTEELRRLHLHIKNSTLLDVSHAESIRMYHPPNLSSIINASTDEDCKRCPHEEPEPLTKIHTDSFKSDKDVKWKTPLKLTNRRQILLKKKVWFKSPVTVETCEAHRTAPTKLNIDTNRPVRLSSPAERIKPDVDTSRAGETSPDDETSKLTVRLNRQVRRSQPTAKFFDFNNDHERDAFFQMMEERCVKLRSAPSFPLSFANIENVL